MGSRCNKRESNVNRKQEVGENSEFPKFGIAQAHRCFPRATRDKGRRRDAERRGENFFSLKIRANDETSIRSILPGTSQNLTPITNARALSDFRHCYTSEHGFGTAAVRTARTRLSHHIGCLLRSDWYLLLMKSRRRREKRRERERSISVRFMARLVRTGRSGVPLLDDDDDDDDDDDASSSATR